MKKNVILIIFVFIVGILNCDEKSKITIPFVNYFHEVIISENSLNIKFKENGIRFVINENGKEIGLSNYNDQIKIESKDKKILSNGGLQLEFCPMVLENLRFKNFEKLPLASDAFVIFEQMDLRSFGKGLQKNILYIFPKTKANDEIKEKMKEADVDHKVNFSEMGMNHLIYIKGD